VELLCARRLHLHPLMHPSQQPRRGGTLLGPHLRCCSMVDCMLQQPVAGCKGLHHRQQLRQGQALLHNFPQLPLVSEDRVIRRAASPGQQCQRLEAPAATQQLRCC
jgi:hypothetical protein